MTTLIRSTLTALLETIDPVDGDRDHFADSSPSYSPGYDLTTSVFVTPTIQDNDVEIIYEQGKLVQQLVQQLSRNDDDHHDNTTVRMALHTQNTAELQRFLTWLGTIAMPSRVPTPTILPSTYDTAANAIALHQRALTLTPLAFHAATLSAMLLRWPGAMGAGVVNAPMLLSSMVAIVRRFGWECPLPPTSRHPRGGGNNHNNNQPTKPPTKKRYRQDDDDSSISDSEDDDDTGNALLQVEHITTTVSPEQFVELGLALAAHIVPISTAREFRAWSVDAREHAIDMQTGLLGTLAAVGGPRSTWPTATKRRAQQLVNSLQLALCRLCVADDGDDDDDNNDNSNDLMRQHQTVVAVLRGLVPLLTMREEVPSGQAGQAAAHAAAGTCLQRLLQTIGDDDVPQHPARWPLRHNMRTSSVGNIGRSSSIGSIMVKTPASRPRRISIGGGGHATNTSTGGETLRLTSPKLKTRISSPPPPHLTRRPVTGVLLGVLQKLLTDRGLEKAGQRAATVPLVHICVELLPVVERARFLQFLIQLCHSKVSGHRLVACDLVGRVLGEVWLWTEHLVGNDAAAAAGRRSVGVDSTTPMSRRQSLTPLVEKSAVDMPTALFGALQGRLADRVPAIRAASATALHDLLQSLRSSGAHDTNGRVGASLSQQGLWDMLRDEAGGSSLLQALQRRVETDDRASVRRAALQAWVELLLVAGQQQQPHHKVVDVATTDDHVFLLEKLCQDVSIQTRKAAADGLTALVELYPTFTNGTTDLQSKLESAWAASVLPMLLDTEGSCSNKAMELVDDVVFVPIVASNDQADMAWRILAVAGHHGGSGTGGGGGASRSETEALKAFMRKRTEKGGSTATDFVKAVLKVVHGAVTLEGTALASPKFAGAWILFDALAHACPPKDIVATMRRCKMNVAFVADACDELLSVLGNDQSAATTISLRRSLQVLAKLATSIEPPALLSCKKKVWRLLNYFGFPPAVIGSAVAAQVAMTAAGTVDDMAPVWSTCLAWTNELYAKCEHLFEQHSATFLNADDESKICRAIHTVGELSMIGFCCTDEDNAPKKTLAAAASDEDIVRGRYAAPPAKLNTILQVHMAPSLPGSNDATPDAIRGHAVLAIGKLCLRNEKLTKDVLTILARELHVSAQCDSTVVQSNALLVLGDLCVKYTNLVDRFLPVMAGCLQSGAGATTTRSIMDSPNPAKKRCSDVRKHAVLILSSLILQDFIKWRGLLFHRFLVAVADDNEEVGNLAEAMLCGPLITKDPKLFFNQFVESLFVLNRCTAHPIYRAAAASGDGGGGVLVNFDGINLDGEVGRLKRSHMYKTMLSRMSDEEKLAITARLSKEVLGSALESGSEMHLACAGRTPDKSPNGAGRNNGENSAFNVLSDALTLLASDALKVGRAAKAMDDDNDVDDPTVSTQIKRIAAAKGRLLSNISRKHLVEIVVPILCNLKAILQKSCSPLLKDLMAFLVDLYGKYKDEVREILANDPSLLQEIEYDAKNFRRTMTKWTATPDKSLAGTPAQVTATA